MYLGRKLDAVRMLQKLRIAAGDVYASLTRDEARIMVAADEIRRRLQAPRTILPPRIVEGKTMICPCDVVSYNVHIYVTYIYLARTRR
jgi:hypothetical protein